MPLPAWIARIALIPSAALCLSAADAPGPEQSVVLEYRAEWRLMHAGDVTLKLERKPKKDEAQWHGALLLKTRGLADSLHHVDNDYSVLFNGGFCAESYRYHVREGKKRREVTVNYQQPQGKATYLERDAAKNNEVVGEREIDVPPCVHDELAALARLRAMRLEPGQSAVLPVSNGKKSVMARVEAQQRQRIKTPSGPRDTIRYEAFLFNDVLYRRRGRLFVWLTDDERRLPVQIRVQLRFYIGTVTLQLKKKEETT
ncbi:MAG: DUF3108 domain-containing protein [Bryobacteraceae bacterium]|nr:DUF3108 domain-containing protein [Bryobacteraceae bacterium]